MDKNTACNGRSPVVAICYDFDKTLSPKDMQEFGLIEKLRCSARDFWQEAGELAEREGMDHILAYMLLILKKAGNDIGITKKDFKALVYSSTRHSAIRLILIFIDSIFDLLNVLQYDII